MKFITMLKVLLGTHMTAQSILYGAKLSSSTGRSVQGTKTIVVIGGGAAGYFSAIECAKLLSESQKKVKNSIRYEVGLHRPIQTASTDNCNSASDVLSANLCLLIGHCFRGWSEAFNKSTDIRW